MKRVFLMPSILMLAMTLQAQTKTTKTATKTKTGITKRSASSTGASLKSNTDSVSYAFGISLGQYMKSQGIKTLNYSMLNKAIDQTIKDQPTLMNAEQANQVMGKIAEAKAKQAAGEKKKKAESF